MTRCRTSLTAPALLLLLLPAITAGAASADSITFRGTSIPLAGLEIESITGGFVHYQDGSGRRWRRPLEDVAALSFDGVPALDAAEARIAARDLAAGVDRLVEAVVQARRPVEQLWVHVRLCQVHDALGQYIQAAGHAAAVWLIDGDPAWRILEPLGTPDEPSYPAAREALAQLDAARQARARTELGQIADRIWRKVQPTEARLAAVYDGPPIKEGSTISGFSVEEIRQRLAQAAKGPAAPEPAPADAAPPPERTPGEPAPARKVEPEFPHVDDGQSAAAIDTLLASGQFAEALAQCEQVAADPGARPLDRFLWQYGRALVASDRPRDAAVMFLRCALLYSGSPHAPASLIETAIIYRDEFEQADTATRLLQRAASEAERQGLTDDAERATRLITSLQTSPDTD